MTANLVIGDVFQALADIPKHSVDLVLTSPPFLALRSYLPGDHSDKGREIGSEATPGEFLDTLLDVVESCARVLAPHGSLVFELGDTYSGSGGAGGDYDEDGLRAGQPIFRQSRSGWHRLGARANQPDMPPNYRKDGTISESGTPNGGPGWPLPKSLACIPALFEVALAYGLNPLTGRRTDRWRVRNLIPWCRPNPPVGALGDKFRPATSYLTVACKARDRWFDLDAVRVPFGNNTHPGYSLDTDGAQARAEQGGRPRIGPQINTHAGAPPLDYWVIPTQPYPGAHYATWPESLCVKPILSMCPERVCTTCGKPSRRIVETDYEHPSWASGGLKNGLSRQADRVDQPYAGKTLGWTDCGCPGDHWRSGVVLDPFAGSGTTLQVATRLGRDAIGIDLDERNEDLIRQRIGLFMGDVSYVNKKGAASGSTQ